MMRPAVKPRAGAAGTAGYPFQPVARAPVQKIEVSGGHSHLQIRVDRLEEGRLGIRVSEQLVLTSVDGPDAWLSGWRAGDVILKVNGEKVRNKDDLRRLLETVVPPVNFQVIRLAGGGGNAVTACPPQLRPTTAPLPLSQLRPTCGAGPPLGGGPPRSPPRSPAAAASALRARAPSGGGPEGRPPASAPGGTPEAAQAGDEHDVWFAFVGAKILVMNDKGHTLKCTVIDVDENRVQVHDDSGELKDQWLPKHSTQIHPDIHHDHLDYEVDDPFHFVGAKVLVMSGAGHPLPCTVVEVDADRVKVRDNANEYDDEWLPKNSSHINPKGGGILQDGDDIDDWLAFAGAKILVMCAEKGHSVPCTVVEVEEHRIKVHDESGEMSDKWLPKHSPHIHPDVVHTPAEVEYVVDDPFSFVGARVLVMSGKGHPLPCTVVEVDADRVKVRDNALEYDDEWLPKNSSHINPKEGGVLQDGDDIDDWLAFVGAKILVMGGNGHKLPCTVIEVEEDRVKVHDDSGELNDQWLPKHAVHIHPDQGGGEGCQTSGDPEAQKVRIFETPEELQKLLSGKRVLHVKGFGSGFGEDAQQDEVAARAIQQFRPDYLVVDGDPWGSGFQRYVKAYAEAQARDGLAVPELVWVKSITEGRPTGEEREKNNKTAREWADQGLPVVVSWLPQAAISQDVDRLFGAGCWEKLQGQKFDFRGAVRLLEAAEPDRPEWLGGLAGTAPGREMYKAIETVESRSENQYFEKCSFENAAKGSAIYRHLRGEGRTPASQGAVSFGGGESVLLEFATLYLSPSSGFDAGQAALFPFGRGRPSDPSLPGHEGSAFTA